MCVNAVGRFWDNVCQWGDFWVWIVAATWVCGGQGWPHAYLWYHTNSDTMLIVLAK